MAAGRGDAVALGAFVRSTQADVWRFCAHLLGADGADDAAQETYLRAVPSLVRFEGRATARTWLLAVARRVCADEVRRRQRRRALGDRVRLAGSSPAEGPDPAGHRDLARLLDALDPDRRAAFVATQLLGLGYADAAEVCGCPVGTIRSRVARARAELVEAVEAADNA